MPYYTRTYNPQPTTRVASTDLKNEFQAIDNALDNVETDVGKGIRAPEATTALPNAASRANKVLSFDGSGNPAVPIAVVDLANAVTAASNAATSETNAANSATAAAASAASIAGGPVTSVNSLTGVVVLAKGDIGLGNVDNTSDATKNAATATLTNKTLTAPTITGAVLNDGYTEEVYSVTGTTPALSPTNGSIQTWTLSANSTPTAGTWAAGQSIILMVTASSYTVTWPSVTWSKVGGGGAAPSLTSSGQTCVILWKVGSTLYGALLGSV